MKVQMTKIDAMTAGAAGNCYTFPVFVNMNLLSALTMEHLYVSGVKRDAVVLHIVGCTKEIMTAYETYEEFSAETGVDVGDTEAEE